MGSLENSCASILLVYVNEIPDDHGLPNFTNAFNSVRRDSIFEAVENNLPELKPYVQSAYANASTLFYSGGEIQSEEGVQQGDPLGPVLFCMAVQPLL